MGAEVRHVTMSLVVKRSLSDDLELRILFGTQHGVLTAFRSAVKLLFPRYKGTFSALELCRYKLYTLTITTTDSSTYLTVRLTAHAYCQPEDYIQPRLSVVCCKLIRFYYSQFLAH